MAFRIDVFKQNRLSIVAALIVVMAVTSALPLQSYAASPEQRCAELGANCICSEPFQMTGFTSVFGWDSNPNDSTTKQCTTSADNPGLAIGRSPGALEIGSDSTVLTKLPTGHNVARYLKGPEGHTGIFEFGHIFKSGDPTARTAMRWYLFYSPNFEFTNGVCLNSGKWFTMRPGFHESSVQGNGGGYLTYGWTGWLPSSLLNCCSVGPGADSSAPPASALKGKWIRIEAIMRNRSGSPGFILEVYRKNITDNGPEYKVVDTAHPTAANILEGWVTGLITPYNGQTISTVTAEWFRNGTCAGYFAGSHFMTASWSTDAGQRIGAAYEIEGGMTITQPVAPVSVILQ